MSRKSRQCVTCHVKVILPEVYCETCKLKHNEDSESSSADTLVKKQNGGYEIRKGKDGKTKIFLKKYNVAIAEFYENTFSSQEKIRKLIQ